MFPYQLRIPKTLRTEDLVEEVARRCWQVVHHRYQHKVEEERIQSNLREEVLHAFSLYLKTYDLCGSADICEDEMRYVGQKNDSPSEVKIYHLQLPVWLDLFLEVFASLLQDALPKLDLISKQKVHDDLKFVLSSFLKQYLSINRWCGRIQMCQHSRPTSL
jgi:hypothetical protein